MAILRDIKHVFEILFADGFSGLARSGRRWLSRRIGGKAWVAHRKPGGGTWSAYSEEAKSIAFNYDFTPQLIQASKALQQENAGTLDIKSITWFIPDFLHPFYGGIYTILRFADYLQQAHGVKNQFAVVGSLSEEVVLARISQAFPALGNSKVQRIRVNDTFDSLEPTDASIATLWNTAYFLLRFQKTRRKFYFLQDLESLFYPAGSTYAQVEATYRFGFYGLVNTPALKEIYAEKSGGKAEYFIPCVDTQSMYPDLARKSNTDKPYKVFFYGRPEHPRNAFELGSTALRKLKVDMGNRVEIVSAGAQWNPEEYGLKDVVHNMGLLSLEQTHALYRQCDAGMVLMFTRHPSYLPFELMASGCLVVTNYNAATTWLLKDEKNCLLSEASPSCLAERIAYGLQNQPLREDIVANALAEVKECYSDWSQQIEKIYRYMRTLEVGQ